MQHSHADKQNLAYFSYYAASTIIGATCVRYSHHMITKLCTPARSNATQPCGQTKFGLLFILCSFYYYRGYLCSLQSSYDYKALYACAQQCNTAMRTNKIWPTFHTMQLLLLSGLPVFVTVII